MTYFLIFLRRRLCVVMIWKHTLGNTHTHIYIYIYVYICVCEQVKSLWWPYMWSRQSITKISWKELSSILNANVRLWCAYSTIMVVMLLSRNNKIWKKKPLRYIISNTKAINIKLTCNAQYPNDAIFFRLYTFTYLDDCANIRQFRKDWKQHFTQQMFIHYIAHNVKLGRVTEYMIWQ